MQTQSENSAPVEHDQVPLIFTSRGNVPIADLHHFIEWVNTTDEVQFIEVYKAGDGEVVKRSAHTMKKLPPAALGAEQASFG